MTKRLNFKFKFPPIYGEFPPFMENDGSIPRKIFIYGNYPFEGIIELINRVTLDYVEKKVKGNRPRQSKLEYRFPPWCLELYDINDGTIYIYGGNNEKDVESMISHATLHFVVQKKAGKKTSLNFDKLDPKDYEMD